MLTDPDAGVQTRRDPPHPRTVRRAGEVIVTLGRHAGRRLADCPDDYLRWLVGHSTSPRFRDAAAELLELRRVVRPLPAPAEPPVLAPLDLSAYVDCPGSYVLDFGACRGQRLDDVDDEYLTYVATCSWHDDVRYLAASVLADRAAERSADPYQVAPRSTALAADVLPALVFDFEQKLRTECGDGAVYVRREVAVATLRGIVSTHTGRRVPTDDELAEDAEGR